MSLTYYKYHLPFTASFQTNKKTFNNREGIFIAYDNGDIQCYGEAAPLPGYSSETLEDVLQVLNDIQDILEKKLSKKSPVEWLRSFYKEEKIPPSLQFGLDSIAYQIQAYRFNSNLWTYLFPIAPNKVAVNAIVSLHTQNYLKTVEKQIAEGFKTIKYKIGIDFDLELSRLKKVRSQFPDITIRLDANQAWTVDEAAEKCQQLELLNIEYCEEPLKNPSPKNYDVLSNTTALPLALDESIYQVSDWPNILSYSSYLILKPMLLGSFTKIFETKRFADTHNNKAVFTTSLESGIGRRITAIMASGKGAPQTAHGLNTGKLLAKDVHSDTFISNGFYYLDKLPEPNEASYHLQKVSSKLF